MLRWIGSLLIVCVILISAEPLHAGTYSVTIQSKASNAQDSYIVQDAQTENDGTKPELRVKASGGTKNRHVVFDVNLPTLTGKTVLQAWLKLTQTAASSPTPIDARIYPVTETWTESVVSWKYRSTILLVQQPWTVPGGTAGPYWTDRALLSDDGNGSQVSWQVGPIVNAWLLGDLAQSGFLIQGLPEGSDREVVFRSSEFTTDPTATPQLLLYYTDERPAIRSGTAEIQPKAVREGAVGMPISLWLDVNAKDTTPSGTPTGFDLVTMQHGGALLVTSLDGIFVDGVSVDPAQVTWYDNGTSLNVRLPRIVGNRRVEVRMRANVLSKATTDDLSFPVYVDDTTTPGAGVQVLWPGDADGTSGNGDNWNLAVTSLPAVRLDLVPDSTSVVARLCTNLQLFGQDSQGTHFTMNADSFRVIPATVGTMALDGTFCGSQAGTAKVVAFSGSLRDTSIVTVLPPKLPTVSSITLRNLAGTAVNSLAPRDTMFLDVSLSDGDGFRDITALNFELYYAGHAGQSDSAAFHAAYRWSRTATPAWSLVDPVATSWSLVSSRCSVDTLTNSTAPQTVRLAFVPGRIARASSAGAWNVALKVFSATPPDTASGARAGLDCATRLELTAADSLGAFAPARAGLAAQPLTEPADGNLTLTVWTNAAYDLLGAVANLVGATSPGDTIHSGPPSRPISWAFRSDAAGGSRLDTTAVTLLSSVAAPTIEVATTRDLYLWMDYPASTPAQNYRGSLRLTAQPVGGGAGVASRSLSVLAQIVGTGQAASSAKGEVLPHEVQVGVPAQSFTAYLLPTFQAGDTGLDRIQVHLPPGYGPPTVTGLRVAGLPAAFSDSSNGSFADVRMATRVQSTALIEVQLQAACPTIPDSTGADFVIFFDDVSTSVPPQVAVQGDANGIADGNTWRVTVRAGPAARVSVAPESASCFVDSSLAFSAMVEDAYGNPITASVAWSTQGGVGSIDAASGVFTGSAIGSGLVIAASGSVRDTAHVTVRPVRGLSLRIVDGPDSLYQGEGGAQFHLTVENLGVDTAVMDSVSLLFRRGSADAGPDFHLSAAPDLPFKLQGGESISIPFDVDVSRNAPEGIVTVDAFVSGAEESTGIRVRDSGADAPHDVLVTTGGISLAASQSAQSVQPGSRSVPLFTMTVSNLFPDERTLTSLQLVNRTIGAGTPDQLDAEFGDLSLYEDDGDGVFEPKQDAKLLTTVLLDGSVNFTPLKLSLPPHGSVRLFAAGDVSLAAADGDRLDLALADSTQIELTPSSYERNPWPLDPSGNFVIDGLVAGQITVHPVAPGGLVTGSSNQLALDVTLPPNGYKPDRLLRLAVTNRGSAQVDTDIRGLALWADNGDGVFDPANDRLVGPLLFTGDRWQRTGLTESVPVTGLRLFVTADLANLATEGHTVLLGLPASPSEGAGMESGDSGPLDQPAENPYPLPIRSAERITITAAGIGQARVTPGQRDAPVLDLVLTNSYVDLRTLSRLAITNETVGSGNTLALDHEVQTVTLREDGDGDGLLGDFATDPALGVASFSGGRATFDGLGLGIPPGASRRLFVTVDVSRIEAADGDTLSASLVNALDLEFQEPTSTAAAWPLTSNARLVVDGLTAEQITSFGAPGASLGPGDGPTLALDLLIPKNGYRDDELRSIRVVNAGTAGAGDLAQVRLWRDGGDGLFTPGSGDDQDLGALALLGGAWQSPPLTQPLTGAGARLFVSVTATSNPADSSTVQLALPLGGIDNASGNDGPLDVLVRNPQTLTISTSPLLATLETVAHASTVGDGIVVRMVVRNRGGEAVTGVTPTALSLSGSASAYLQSGPTPSSFDIAPAQADTFTWVYVSTASGEIEFRGGAAGTGAVSGITRRAVETSSNRHTVFIPALDADIVPVQSMPAEVSRGQTNVIPFSLTFTNTGGEGASDILVRGFHLRLEDGNGAAIVPSTLIDQVIVAEGTNVYLSKSAIETSGSDLDLTLTSAARVTPEQPATLSLKIGITATATAPSFRLVLLDSTEVQVDDATSGTPVRVGIRSGGYPLRSRTARVVADATELQVQALALPERRVEPGTSDVPLLALRAVNPGVDGVTSDIRIDTIGILIADTTGVPLSLPADWLDRVTVRTPSQTFAARVLRSDDGSNLILSLAPSLSVPVNTPVDFQIQGDIADSSALGAFSIRLLPPPTLEARDRNTLDSVLVSYATDPIAGTPVIVERAADRVRVRGTPLLPASMQIGNPNVPALAITIHHPASAGVSRVRVDSLAVTCRDELRRALAAGSYLSRVRILWNGVELSNAAVLPATDGVSFALGGSLLGPGDSAVVRVVVDIAATAPASFFELTVAASGVVAEDANSGTRLLVEPEPGAELPLSSGLTHLESPSRELVAGLASRIPAALLGGFGETVAGVVHLTNPAASGSGPISVDHLTLRAADRAFQPIALGRVITRVAAYVNGARWAQSASLSTDSTTAWLVPDSLLEVAPGGSVDVELRIEPATTASGASVRLGLDGTGIGVVQPQSALLEIQVRPEGGATFPLWTEAASLAVPSLKETYSNYPNPFAAGREATSFVYYLPKESRISLVIYTPTGDRVITLAQDSPRGAGLYQNDVWNGRNGVGDVVRNGVYVAELVAQYVDGTRDRVLRKVAVVR